jgi:hypothetical protein
LEGKHCENWDGCLDCGTGGASDDVCGLSGNFGALSFVDEIWCEGRGGERLDEGVVGSLCFEWVDYCELLR